MKRALNAGFTLIELVVVIVILGILAAVAVPQFQDLASDARTAAAQGGCGALQSSAVLLYASNKAASPIATIISNTQTSGITLAGTCAVPTSQSGTTTVNCAAIPGALCQ